MCLVAVDWMSWRFLRRSMYKGRGEGGGGGSECFARSSSNGAENTFLFWESKSPGLLRSFESTASGRCIRTP